MDNKQDVLDNGPFFHGTKAELKIGDLLKPQHGSLTLYPIRISPEALQQAYFFVKF